ncbi:Gag polyprotein [Labeo rohita]|uniref:Gag polyprotein n=1 Tax=Labeo rohita TaxID=84645 RepID=A0ABQ8L1W0_LABRO|nr:Gag polyprotein [Labeo rohita]
MEKDETSLGPGPREKTSGCLCGKTKLGSIGDKPPPYCTPKITAPSAPKFKMTEMNTETAKSAKVSNEMEVFNERSNGAMVWLRSGNGITVKPIKMADMEAICKSLPSPQNPSKFVTILQTHTRYAHFTGADYRAVLARTLEADVTESMLITECPTLCYENDKISGTATASSPHEFFWEKSENHDTFFKELRIFPDKRMGNRQDLSFAANTKQKPKESASDFYLRFKKSWVEESKLLLNTEMRALFINTFLNNMQCKQAQLIRITTTNLFDMEIDALGKRVRELDSSGGFVAKTEAAMFTGQEVKGIQYGQGVEVKPRLVQPKNTRIVCYLCGRPGHKQRFCRSEGQRERGWIKRKFQMRQPQPQQGRDRPQPQQRGLTSAQYPTTWDNKQQ